MNPKVSILMSVYNGARDLREAVDSILKQSFTDFEFIIVNDASNDNSPAILNEYAAKDKRIKLINNEFNLGLTKNLNKAIRESKGEYLARFDSDDISYPDRLKMQVEFLDKNPNCALVGTWSDIIDGSGKIMRTVKYPTSSNDVKKVLIRYNPFFHSSAMFRKSAVNAVGPYDESWRFAQDYELWLRIAEKYDIANIPQVLLGYRETGGSITASKNRAQVGFVLKAKLRALKRGQYSKFNYIHLLRSYISWVFPVWLKRFAKKLR